MKKSIAILTSGGDAQGMNSAVISVVKKAWKENMDAYLVYDGYKGLINNDIKKATPELIEERIQRGGTFLGSARLPEFAQIEVREKAVAVLKKRNIDSLVVIGGDGSYMGAAKLAEMGINTVGLPGTIDNDISSTDWTIGFDTALNIVVDSIDKIRETAKSHDRTKIIEVMGRYCGDLTMFAALATDSEIVSVPESKLTEEEIIERVKELKKKKARPIMIIVTEHLYNVHELAKRIQNETGAESRAHILGYTQRGGTPTAMDRVRAALLAEEAVNKINEDKSGICLGWVNGKIKDFDIIKAVKKKNASRDELINKIRLLQK